MAVVGGGAAGIRTVSLLKAAGLDVVLLEARSRLGGRVLASRVAKEWLSRLARSLSQIPGNIYQSRLLRTIIPIWFRAIQRGFPCREQKPSTLDWLRMSPNYNC